MERDRDNQVDSPPKIFLPPEGFVDHLSQHNRQRPEFAVFEKQDGILEKIPVAAGGAVPAEGRNRNSAGTAQMAFSGSVEKPSADGARRRAMKPDPVQAIEAKNSLAGIFKKPPACFAKGREKR